MTKILNDKIKQANVKNEQSVLKTYFDKIKMQSINKKSRKKMK
ncbi:hypothetical protein [Entomoplasma ellychniae]|nr:hypothetical protein [Entomoplasma ellychniae]